MLNIRQAALTPAALFALALSVTAQSTSPPPSAPTAPATPAPQPAGPPPQTVEPRQTAPSQQPAGAQEGLCAAGFKLSGTWEVWKPPADPMGEAGGRAIVRFSQFRPGLGLMFTVTGLKEFPVLANIPENDFPGEAPRLRVDSNKPLIIGPSSVSMKNGRKLLRELLAGQGVIAEWREWPDPAARHVCYPLAGFAEAWRAAGGLEPKP